MRPIGFSTGALALADFQLGLAMLKDVSEVSAVELSALRAHELAPLANALTSLDLERFTYVAFHAPSAFTKDEERTVVDTLAAISERGWPIIVHPDAVHDWTLWRRFGDLLCIENMDKRKPIGRTVPELAACFDRAPDARLCLDLGHARQVDPSMTVTFLILQEFGDRLKQVHLSDVSTDSRHNRLSYSANLAFKKIAGLIPTPTPIILETPVTTEEIAQEIQRARAALAPSKPVQVSTSSIPAAHP